MLYICSELALIGPLRKGTEHRAFPLNRRCSSFLYPGCVLPEVMVLIPIQWIIVFITINAKFYGQTKYQGML